MGRRGGGGRWRREGLYRGYRHGVAVTGACNDRSPCRLVTAILSLPRETTSETTPAPPPSTEAVVYGGTPCAVYWKRCGWRACDARDSIRSVCGALGHFLFFFFFLHQRSAGRVITGARTDRITARWTMRTFAEVICQQSSKFLTMSRYYLHRKRERESYRRIKTKHRDRSVCRLIGFDSRGSKKFLCINKLQQECCRTKSTIRVPPGTPAIPSSFFSQQQFGRGVNHITASNYCSPLSGEARGAVHRSRFVPCLLLAFCSSDDVCRAGGTPTRAGREAEKARENRGERRRGRAEPWIRARNRCCRGTINRYGQLLESTSRVRF